jgi:NAD(P)-dependent dehydrogenase (short-subunit alcohol dehydrogenase family)
MSSKLRRRQSTAARATRTGRSRTSSRITRLQRRIQRQVADNDRKHPAKEFRGSMQAGARAYPEPPLPAQHKAKPGHESQIDPLPMYLAPYYRGSGKLQDKVALVTGADSGIGRAVAVLFAREGADIAVQYLSEDSDALETVAAIEREGRHAIAIKGDVGRPVTCKEAVDATIKRFGHLDVLVNNAAFQVHTYRLEDLSDEHFDLTVRTNLYGYFFMSRAAVPHMANGSAIVNTGSVTGLLGNKDLLDYSLTKGGIHAFTRSLATQLIPRGIRVNAVAPGPVWTPLNPSDKQGSKVRQFGAGTAMGRPAQPEEIAPAYVFLASAHCSSYITGEILPIIGGYSGG